MPGRNTHSVGTAAIITLFSVTPFIPSAQANPMAHPEQSVVADNARFTVLTPAMIRMEWSPDGQFEDRASMAFLDRRFPAVEFETERRDGWLTLKTPELVLRYREGAGRFDARNLSIELQLNGKAVVWKPGAEATGNLRGTTRTLDGVSGSCPLEPGLLSRDGWVVVDDSSTPLFDDGEPPWAVAREAKKSLDWYFLGYGHDYRRALMDFTRVAGSIPLPPRYVFGAWWSRYWAYSDEELKELVTAFDEHDVPLDVLVIDMDWHLDGWTGYTWNPKYFPDPAGFLRWVEERGLRTTLNLHPHDGVGEHEEVFDEFARAVGLDPEEVERIPFEVADKEYMKAYFELLHHPKERMGVDFWWIDWQQGKKSGVAGLDPLFWLNHLHWMDMRRNPERGDKRPLIFSRWGGLGNHRYQIGFSGDTFCNWPSLAFQPYFTATAGNVGFGYWSHDIGGHQPGPVLPELYTRWVQFGVFSPALRTHTTTNPEAERRIWKFPQPYFEAMREAFHLRYALIPYIYTAARQCHDTAVPLCRPLYYEWPEMDEAYRHPGEYLFGDQMLVAPVTKPVGRLSGCADEKVWLPPGEWTDWFTGKTVEGPTDLSLQVPLDEIPVFVRGGGVVAAMPAMRRSDARPVDPLILHIFPGASGSARIYEDDGISTGYLDGRAAWTPVTHETSDGKMEIVVGPVEGSFEGMLRSRTYEIRLRDTWPPREVRVNGEPLVKLEGSGSSGWWYEGESLTTVIRVPVEDTNKATNVTVLGEVGAAKEWPLRDGLRGKFKTLKDIGVLIESAPGNSERTREVLRMLERVSNLLQVGDHDLATHAPSAIDNCAELFLKVIPDLRLDDETSSRILARLLGLSFDLEGEATGETQRGIELLGHVGISPISTKLNALEATLSLAPVRNWSLTDDGTWGPFVLRPDVPATIDTRLISDGLAQTMVMNAELSLTGEGIRLKVPLEKVLLPSINHWWIVGPFDAPGEDRLGTVFGPEEKLDLEATYEGKEDATIGWRKFSRPMTPDADLAAEFHVEFHKVFDELHYEAVAYALTYLHAPEEMDAVLAVGSDDGVVVWLNGEEVHRNDVGRAYTSREDRIPIRLRAGANRLLLKISQGGGMWGFGAHVETASGEPLPQVVAKFEE